MKRYQKYISIFTIIGVLCGAALGYLYYLKVGCQSGSCKIASNPWISTIWGAALGYLLSDIIKGWKKKRKDQTPENTKPGE